MIKLKQIFCRHKRAWAVPKPETVEDIHGRTVCFVCERCGKVVEERFMDWDEQLRCFGKYL